MRPRTTRRISRALIVDNSGSVCQYKGMENPTRKPEGATTMKYGATVRTRVALFDGRVTIPAGTTGTVTREASVSGYVTVRMEYAGSIPAGVMIRLEKLELVA